MATQWHYTKGGERHGPVSSDQLRQLAASGQIHPTDLVWRDGMAEWQKASSVKGLFPSQASGPTEPPPIPKDERQPVAGPISATVEPAAGQTEKRGLLGTLSSLGHAAKTAAVAAAKGAERTKITNIDLPKAYAVLGRDVHDRGAYQEFPDLYRQIDDLLARLRNLEGASSKQPSPSATFADKAKTAAVATKQKAEAQAMRLQLSRLMSKLGEAVYQRHGNAAGSSETTGPIASLLSRASMLAAEVEQQRQASGGRFITRRRALAAAGIFCACVILLGVVGTMAPGSRNHPITEAGTSGTTASGDGKATPLAQKASVHDGSDLAIPIEDVLQNSSSATFVGRTVLVCGEPVWAVTIDGGLRVSIAPDHAEEQVVCSFQDDQVERAKSISGTTKLIGVFAGPDANRGWICVTDCRFGDEASISVSRDQPEPPVGSRELQVTIGTALDTPSWVHRLLNPSLGSIKCHATSDQLILDFDADVSKWFIGPKQKVPWRIQLLVRLFDRNGNYLTHFITAEGFTVHRNVYEFYKNRYDNVLPGASEEGKAQFLCKLLKPSGNRLVYNVNMRDLRDAACVEVGFYQEP